MSEGLGHNGWTARVRSGRDKHYYHAQKNGILKVASKCDSCGIGFPGNPVPYHAEDYGPTLEDYWRSCVPLCNRCHAMVHARFATPNLWRLFLTQLKTGSLDEATFPQSSSVAALLTKFKKRKDFEFVEMPERADDYLASLPITEYSGPMKAATLLVIDQRSQSTVEVPDWTIYGNNLENLSDEEHHALDARGISVDDFLSDINAIARKPTGERIYTRLYLQT